MKFWLGIDRGGHSAVVISEKSDYPAKVDVVSNAKTRVVRPDSSSAAASTAKAPENLEWFLANYYVDVDLNGLTVEQALVRLKQAITQANLLRRPWLEEMTLTTKGAPATACKTITSFLPRTSAVKSLIKLCALYQTIELRVPGTIMIFETPAVTSDSLAITTQAYTGSPILLPSPRQASSGGLESETQDEVTKVEAAAAVLARLGLDLASNEHFELEPGGSLVSLTADQNKHARFAEICEVAGHAVMQVNLNCKIIHCPANVLPSGFDASTGVMLTDEQFQKFTRNLSESGPSISSMSLPSIVTRQSQRARIEIVREVQVGQPQGPDWIGLSIPMDPSFVGETVSCFGNCEFRLPAGEMIPEWLDTNELSAKLLKMAQKLNLRSYQTDFETFIPDGSTAMFTLDVPTTDGVTLFCLSAVKIDPAGSRIKHPVSKSPLIVSAGAIAFSADKATATCYGNVRFRSSSIDIDCNELELKLKDGVTDDDVKHLADESRIEKLQARSDLAGNISFIFHGQPEAHGTCQELEFDVQNGVVTMKRMPNIQQGTKMIEATSEETFMQIDSDGTIIIQGPARTSTMDNTSPKGKQ